MVAMPTPALFGCDVGKDEIVVHDRERQSTTKLPNTPEALARFAEALPADALVVCEATGGYEAVLLEAVTKAGHQAHRANPRKVKAFIRSFGTLAKTDAIDALAIARYGAERHADLERWQMPEASLSLLQGLVKMRRDLIASRGAWTNRIKAPGGATCAACLKPLIDAYHAALEDIDTRIERLLRENEELSRKAEALTAIPSIGPKIAAGLLAVMPELGSLNRKTAASLAGLAPHPNQSGAKEAYRRTRGGRPEGKRVLFMAAMVATRHNPALKAFYDRLIKNGKKPIVALVAVMRKLITIANAVIRDHNAQQLS